VFLQGVMDDGDMDWSLLVHHLSARFTCHLPSLRGRGLSGDHPDLSFGRLVDDFFAYVESMGHATGLVGWSLGADLALTMAARSGAVDSLGFFRQQIEHRGPTLLIGRARRDLSSGAGIARIGHEALRHRPRAVRSRPPPRRTDTRDPRRRARRALTHPEALDDAFTEFFAPAQKGPVPNQSDLFDLDMS
jgi:pimeloyl-ACP methyl ester carboxylesterase